jgi:hypothetical protein
MPVPSRASFTCVGRGTKNPEGAKGCIGCGHPSTGPAASRPDFAGTGSTRDDLSPSRHRSRKSPADRRAVRRFGRISTGLLILIVAAVLVISVAIAFFIICGRAPG